MADALWQTIIGGLLVLIGTAASPVIELRRESSRRKSEERTATRRATVEVLDGLQAAMRDTVGALIDSGTRERITEVQADFAKLQHAGIVVASYSVRLNDDDLRALTDTFATAASAYALWTDQPGIRSQRAAALRSAFDAANTRLGAVYRSLD